MAQVRHLDAVPRSHLQQRLAGPRRHGPAIESERDRCHVNDSTALRNTLDAWNVDRRRSAFGPLRSFAGVRFVEASARRGRRYPAGAQPVAVGAARRLHCDARPGVASRTHCVRCALSVRTTATSQSTKRASRADPGLCFSSPQKSPPPGTARRAARWCLLRLNSANFPAKGVGWLTERVAGPGEARPGGHERSRPPDGLGSLQPSIQSTAMGRK